MEDVSLKDVKLFFGVYKLNEKGKLQQRVIIFDFKAKELLNTDSGTLKRSFRFKDIVSVKLSPDSALCVYIRFASHPHYEIHCQTPADALDLHKLLTWVSNDKQKDHTKEIISLYYDNSLTTAEVDNQGSMTWARRSLSVYKNEIRMYKKSSVYPTAVIRILPCIVIKIGRKNMQISSKVGFKHVRFQTPELRDETFAIILKLKNELNELSIERSRRSVQNIISELVREVTESSTLSDELKLAFTGVDNEMELVSINENESYESPQ